MTNNKQIKMEQETKQTTTQDCANEYFYCYSHTGFWEYNGREVSMEKFLDAIGVYKDSSWIEIVPDVDLIGKDLLGANLKFNFKHLYRFTLCLAKAFV